MTNAQEMNFLSSFEGDDEKTSIKLSDPEAKTFDLKEMDESVVQESYRNLSLELSKMDISIFAQDALANVTDKPFRFGFIGLNNISCAMIKNFIATGYPIVLWDNTNNMYSDSVAVVKKVITPSCVIEMADIIYYCGTGKCEISSFLGKISGLIRDGTGFIDLVSTENSISDRFVEDIECQGGRYLKISKYGGDELLKNGLLTLVASGTRSLFDECAITFSPIAKKILYCREIEELAKINLIINFIQGIVVTGIAEGLALAKHAGLPISVLFQVLNLSSPLPQKVLADAKIIVENIYSSEIFLSLVKDVHKGLELANELDANVPLGTMSKEVMKIMKTMNTRKCPHIYSIVDPSKQKLTKRCSKRISKRKMNYVF